MPSTTLPLLPKVFKLFLDRIVEQTNEELDKSDLLFSEKSKIRLEEPLTQRFGSENYHYRPKKGDPYKLSIAYAVHSRLMERAGKEDWTRHKYGLRTKNFNPRYLQDAYSTYRDLERKDSLLEETALELPLRYVWFYLNFIDFDSPYEFLAAEEARLDEQVMEAQRKLFDKYWRTDIIRPSEERLHYTCYTLSNEDAGRLHSFRGLFRTDHRENKIEVVFSGTPTDEEYEGEMDLLPGAREAMITAYTKRENNLRPVVVLLSKNAKVQFRELEICVGNFVNISKEGESYTGAVLFEQLPAGDAKARLDEDMVRTYLQRIGNRVPTGGFHSVEEFMTAFHKLVPHFEKEQSLFNALENRYFECFIMSKKRRSNGKKVAFDRLERTLFHFGSNGRFICRSAYPTHCEEYEGEVRYHSQYKALLQFSGEEKGIYLLPVDYRDLLENDQFEGVYSGITQEEFLAGGRARFYEVTEQSYREGPGLLELDDEETEALLESTDLRDFFVGLRDKHLDDPDLLRRDFPQLQHGGNRQLKSLSGTFYYYRTRTIKAHIREVKRYPVLIKPNGELSVKVRDDGEEYPASGHIFRLNGRGYLHLRKRDRYDGLAIIYPDWQLLGQEGEIIPGLYVSTSKADHLMAGRLFFRRYSFDTTGADFEWMRPVDILIDGIESNPEVDREDYHLIRRLAGQINNYIAVRHPQPDQPHQNYGAELFLAACYLCKTIKDLDWAAETLKRAILYGGFRDVEALRQALTRQEGALYAIRERVQNFPSQYKANDYTGYDRDVHQYLKGLVGEVFGETVNKK